MSEWLHNHHPDEECGAHCPARAFALADALAEAAAWLLSCEDTFGKRPVRGMDEAIEGVRHALAGYRKGRP